AGEVRPMRLLPRSRLVLLLGRRHVDGVMQPAVPRRRHARSLGLAVVDHPAPLHSERAVDLAAAGAEITVAELVLPNPPAIEPSPELGAERLPVPPGEKSKKEGLHH